MTNQVMYKIDHVGKIHRSRVESKRRSLAALFFLLGFLMPIETIAGVWPPAMDALRFGLALVILLTLYRERRELPKDFALDATGLALVASSALLLYKTVATGGDPWFPAVLFISPVMALLLIRERIHFQPLLLGFVAGTSWSALDIILQVLGLPFLGTPSESGFRHGGFSGSSTQVAPLLAVAICVAVTPWAWDRRRAILRIILTLLLTTGLFLSQGRVGVAGLVAAMGILLVARLPRRPLAVTVGSLIFLAGSVATGIASAFVGYVTRSDVSGNLDFSSGRFAFNHAAWQAFQRSAPAGVPPEVRDQLFPHMAVLTAAVDVGVLGLLAISFAVSLLTYLSLFGKGPLVFRMIASITVVTAFLEPYAFFEDLTKISLLLICLASLAFKAPSNYSPRKGSIPAKRILVSTRISP